MKGTIEADKLGETIEKLRALLGGNVEVQIKATDSGIKLMAVRTPEMSEDYEDFEGQPVDLRQMDRANYFG